MLVALASSEWRETVGVDIGDFHRAYRQVVFEVLVVVDVVGVAVAVDVVALDLGGKRPTHASRLGFEKNSYRANSSKGRTDGVARGLPAAVGWAETDSQLCYHHSRRMLESDGTVKDRTMTRYQEIVYRGEPVAGVGEPTACPSIGRRVKGDDSSWARRTALVQDLPRVDCDLGDYVEGIHVVGRWETRGSSDCNRGMNAAAAVELSDRVSQVLSGRGQQMRLVWTDELAAVEEQPLTDR
ncbi:hypothetical protein RRF57_011303 [Xylaria bambusicola]|uniref:Uncharacterized protein n=1 Tax=Xylaria bambusicola TaxID=326684 RepID=A0AAN7UZC4_9PEZI